MGLRFRKSISICPGAKLNFGTKGVSLSTGTRGFRRTFHSSGKVTTSVGIPGTGLYYVDTANTKKQSERHTPQTRSSGYYNDSAETRYNNSYITDNGTAVSSDEKTFEVIQLDKERLKSIHKSSDDCIDWTEVLVSPLPPDENYNREMWRYYHEVASKILSGDIDAYLQLIYEVNPLDDLLEYGGNFEFGTDKSDKIEVEFTVNENALSAAKRQLNAREYNNLLQDYVCSVCIRIARDMFALLPIEQTIVHAVLRGDTVVSVDFERGNLSKIKFGYIDPSDTLSLFKHNMNYTDENVFSPVEILK